MQLKHFAHSLADFAHLLPTQQELLQRLLFQLTFNDLKRFAILGTIGSGKTTLALVLAEVFSAEHNVALISAVQGRAELEQQLLTQWLGANQASHVDFEQALHHLTAADQPLVLLVDNFQQFPETEQQWLLGLPVSLCCFCESPLASAQLNLTINPLTLADAQQLLQQEQLDPLTLASRLAAAQGNIRLLLDPPAASAQRSSVKPALPWQYLLPGLALLLLLISSSWYWWQTDNDKQTLGSAVPNQHTAKPQQPDTTLTQIIEEPTVPADDEQQAEPFKEQSAASNEFPGNLTEPLPLAETLAIEPEQPVLAPELTDSTDESHELIQTQSEPEWPADEAMLLAASASMVALQFAVLSDLAAVERFEQQYPGLIFYRYQRSWQGKLQWVLLSELQADSSAALSLIATLPARLQAAGPFAKSLRPVQQEIKALQRLREQQGQQHD
ncbi:SPOR domain-containing protein [Arsukibacterium sp.]|uniref:SPOR domain-containing protein n=1 Tax=Arsukibacterium sp. TaxID=1977258 RepID=UPI002FDB2269